MTPPSGRPAARSPACSGPSRIGWRGLSVHAAGLHLDLSKQAITGEGLRAGIDLARAGRCGGSPGSAVRRERRQRLGAPRRPAPGAARAGRRAVRGAGKSRCPRRWRRPRGRMRALADGVRSGEVRGSTGERFRAVVHIGIGGSDLGPRLVWGSAAPAGQPHRAALRRQCRRRGNRRRPARTASRLHPGDRGLQDLHHPGDPRQRPRRARLAGAAALGEEGCERPSRRGIRRAAENRPLRDRSGPGVRLRRLGGWALLAVVGGGALLRPRARLRSVRKPAPRRRGHGRPTSPRRRWSATPRC